MNTFWPKRDKDGRHVSEPKVGDEIFNDKGESCIIGHIGPDIMPSKSIFELRDEIKALRSEVEVLKPSKRRCPKCGRYKENLSHYSLATGATRIDYVCLNNECVE